MYCDTFGNTMSTFVGSNQGPRNRQVRRDNCEPLTFLWIWKGVQVMKMWANCWMLCGEFCCSCFASTISPQAERTTSRIVTHPHPHRPMTDKLLILDEKKVHWFPRHISELDLIANRTLVAGVDLMSEDHPGFHDAEYRRRRDDLSLKAQNHRWDRPIPRIEYTSEETAVWTAVWDKMEGLWGKYACQEFLRALELMKSHCGYSRTQIPQQEDISKFLQRRTNFRMRPVAGLLSSRDFLNGLAFRVFFSTQYMRHHSHPLYTPEPDLVHEFCGHAPMFADQSFADFSQEIGLASLGASDEDIEKLARCYWHSVEFGLCRQDGENKAYGAGLLSSFGELEYACSEEHPGADEPPEIKPWNPEVASHQEFPITSYQPTYFLAESLEDVKIQMRRYCEDLPRPFFAQHNPQTDTIHIDRPVVRTKGVPSK
uniref:phenylalanine 4-monooxygenase n=1 Tax=Amphora coffeiformis TaxID=265554 RepID=A0A7S3KZ98_9STRA